MAQTLTEKGVADAIHVRDRAKLGVRDDSVFGLAQAEDRIVVTSDWTDFEPLASDAGIHSGMIFFENGCMGRDGQLATVHDAILFIADKDLEMINAILRVKLDGEMSFEPLPREIDRQLLVRSSMWRT